MSSATEINQALDTAHTAETEAVADAARAGLRARPYTLPAWLFYDRRGSELFEQITELSEYYLTRTERALFDRYADEMLQCAAGEDGRELAFLELGAGTATKTGVLLRAAVQRQGQALYVPVDVSASALEEAERSLMTSIPGLSVEPQIANYFTGPIDFRRPGGARMLALYIGSSIGNFDPDDARRLLRHLRAQLRPGDALLLGTDLAPSDRGGADGSEKEGKSVAMLLAAYDDAAGVTAAFNRNVLERLARELGAKLDITAFRHEARWNRAESRIEMHLRAERPTVIVLPGGTVGDAVRAEFRAGETIHTENSYKYTADALRELLMAGGFQAEQVWSDDRGLFAVTLARVE